MDKIFSTRISMKMLKVLDELAKKLHVSKKKSKGFDIVTETSGAWKREKSPGEIAAAIRQKFSANFTRHQP